MKNLLLIISIFLCLSANAQNVNELWHYDAGTGKWFLIVPERDDNTENAKDNSQQAKHNKVKEEKKERENKYVDFSSNESCDAYGAKESMPLFSKNPDNVIIPNTIVNGVKVHKPWNVYGIVRTNLIGDALFVPNIGGEITVGKNWSLGADFYLQWLRDKDKDKFYQTYVLDVDARYWCGKQHAKRQLSGWHFGPYGQAITWDWENGNKGYQSRVFFWTFAVGGEIGYNKPLGKKQRWALDFSIGVGYLHTKYNVYYPEHNRHYYLDHRQCKNIFGPTKIGVSLNYFLK